MGKQEKELLREKVIEEITRMVASPSTTPLPLMASVLLRLRVKIIPKESPFLAAVDAAQRTLSINEALLNSGDSLRAVLAHEALHILNGTFVRQGKRELALWNYATDLEINWMLKDMRIEIKRGLYVKEFHNMHAEEIHERLHEKTKDKKEKVQQLALELKDLWWEYHNLLKSGDGEDSDASREVREQLEILKAKIEDVHRKLLQEFGFPENADMSYHQEIKDDEEEAIARQFIIETAISALQMSKMGIGKLPGALERIIEEFTRPKVRWQDYLEDAVLNVLADDYSYRKPYKPSMVFCDTYTPTLSNPKNQDVIVMVDTSGSIGQEALRIFLTEVKELLSLYRVTFIACDAEVQAVVEDGDIEEVVKNVRGGGGTVFAPVFEWVKENLYDRYNIPIILMTDGYNADREIEKPWNIGKVITLTTTGKAPDGIASDYVITIKEE